MTSPAQFWSSFSPHYDGHVLSRDAVVLSPRIAQSAGPVARVLDAGCGTGQVTVELARVASQVDAVDFVEETQAIAVRSCFSRPTVIGPRDNGRIHKRVTAVWMQPPPISFLVQIAITAGRSVIKVPWVWMRP
jgi:SAM-dependent methyltransferase